MKLICDRGALVESLNLVSGVIISRTPKPVLTYVKLTAADGSLTLAATDLEVSIRISTPSVDVKDAGEALVKADKLNQIVRESIDATVSIEADQEKAVIRGEDSRFEVYGYPVKEFPPVPEFEGDADFDVQAGDLAKLIEQTIFATARENSRYAINGVLMERNGNKLSLIATDGRRLALAKGGCKSTKDPEAHTTAIIPTKALQLLLRLFTIPEKLVHVKMADNQIIFASDDAVLTSNLVEGNFPPYKDVIPRDGDKKATLNTDALASAVRRAALLTNEESKGVRMAFGNGVLTLSSRAVEVGEAEIKVPVADYVGENVEIGFNPTFVLDALKVVDTEQVTLEMKAGNKPGVLRTGPDFLYVIMPVNLQ
jgi:DNA polymerase-3 subunit beta